MQDGSKSTDHVVKKKKSRMNKIKNESEVDEDEDEVKDVKKP